MATPAGFEPATFSLEGYQSDNHVNGAVDMISVHTRLDAVQENDLVHLRLDEALYPLLPGHRDGRRHTGSQHIWSARSNARVLTQEI
jgi:hypothetical protein